MPKENPMNRKLKFRIWNGTEMIYDVVGKFGTFYVNPGNNGHGLDPNDLASLTPFTTKYSDDTPSHAIHRTIRQKRQRNL